jgi:thiol:disulfide interchange protein DsbC
MMQKDMPAPAAQCNTAAIDRNLEFARKYKITGTPTLVAQDGTRVPGAIDSTKIERLLAEARK